jgi:hypothetical protein
MLSIFKARRVCLSLKRDRIVWCGAQLGKYSIKIGYQVLEAQGGESFISRDLCWSKEVLPKVGVRKCNGWILIVERRKRLGMAGPTRCPLCEGSEESMDNLLLNCKYAIKCWDYV